MKKEWKIYEFEKCLQKIPRYNKIPKNKFLLEGIFPIISQEKDFINGYWDNFEDVIEVKKPVVIFGDHTKVVKLIDFNFVVGADGVKIFQPIDEINAEYLAFFLQNIQLDDLGYARHYRLLKKVNVPIPPLEEQQTIVAKLDQAFAAIDQAKANIEKNIANAKELFQSKLNQIFSQKGEHYTNWQWIQLGKICKTGSGGTPLKSKKEYYENGDIPWLLSGEVNNRNITSSRNFITQKGLDNSSAKLFPKDSVLIAMYGATAGQVGILRFESTSNQAVCAIFPNEKFISDFLYYTFLFKKNELIGKAVGNAQPNISQIKIKETEVPLLELEEQQQIVTQLDKLQEQTNLLVIKYQQKLANLEELKKSILEKAFKGELS